MAVSVRAERFASSAQTSRVAAACTLLREQPDTPDPAEAGSKAAAVPSTLNSEFSSKSLLNSPEVSACAVLLGALSLLTLDGSEAEELAWEASPFVLEQPASRPHSRAALTRSERMCF